MRDPPHKRVCWNCDQQVQNLVQVTVSMPFPGRLSVALCPPCYAFDYVTLMRGVASWGRWVEPSSDVLVVEDDPALLLAVSTALEDAGYRVDTARNGEDALIKALHRLPGLIVLDVRLPAMSGTGVLNVLRGVLPQQPVPVIMMSGHDEVSEDDHPSADAFLRKPFTMGDLVGTVQHLMSTPMA